VQMAGDGRFAESGTVQLADSVGVQGCRSGPAQALAVLPSVSQTGAHPFAQNLALELGKHRSSPAMARPAGVVKSSASVSETNPTPRCSSSCSVLSRSVTERPQRSKRHTSTVSISRRRAASSSFSRASRCAAPEPTSLTCITTLQPRRAAYSRRARFCMGSVCWS
jgi:hypothetical protein